MLSEHRLKKLWERFVTAMNSVGLPSEIVVKNHSHQALTSTQNRQQIVYVALLSA